MTQTIWLTQPNAPISIEQPLPNRKTLRQWLLPFSKRDTARAVALLALDYALLFAVLAGTVVLSHWWAKLLAGMCAGFMIGRLFIIGHDACHQSLTPNRKLNPWLGRLAFLPSLTPYSLWEVGHNVIHHGYTNLKDVDFVWQPLSAEEYAALGRFKQLMYRVYRSGWAPGLYYLVEMWWNRMFFPNSTYMPTRRPIFLKDSCLAAAFGVAWIGTMVWAALATEQSIWLTFVMGVAIPFLFWVTMIGFVVYVHHTHTQVVWHDNKAQWTRAAPFVSTTVHLTFPLKIGALLHNIMEHTAHHVDMSVPLYHLKGAQAKLEAMLPERIVIQPFSLGWYVRTARSCKLYDFKQQRWQKF